MLRFIHQLKQEGTGTGPLTGEEIQDAEIFILKGVRRDTFASKTACIKRNFSRVATARHCVVPGQQRDLTSDRKTSVEWQVLQRTPSDCTVKTPSLLSFACISSPPRLLHGGVRDTLVQLREQYWIVQRRQLVEEEIRKCIPCQRMNLRPLNEETAPLPADYVSVRGNRRCNFAGPIYVGNKRLTQKSYIVIFTCAVIGAIHLELVTGMTAVSCHCELRQLVCQWGIRVMHSDNAQAFKPSNKYLILLWKVTRNQEAQNHFSNSVNRKFIVERAPWWGVFHEHLV